MADFAFVRATDLSYDGSGNYSVSFNASGADWAVFVAKEHNGASTPTAVSFDGVSIIGSGYAAASTAHYAASLVRVYVMDATGHAGTHTFNFQWTGGFILEFVGLCGSGAIDAALYDGTPATTEEVGAAGVVTPTAYTPATDKAFPVFVVVDNNASAGTANANCTLAAKSATTNNFGVYYGPLSTPAGTATSAAMNNGSGGYILAVSFALKPVAAGGGGLSIPVVMNQYRQRWA